MDDIMMPREGSKWVANLSKHVHINSEGVKKAADLVIINKYVNPSENVYSHILIMYSYDKF